MRAARHSGADTAVRLLLRLIQCDGSCRTGDLIAFLGAPRASVYRIARILAQSGLLDLRQRGKIRLGTVALNLVQRRDEMLRLEDAVRVKQHPRLLTRGPRASHNLSCHSDSVRLSDCRRFRRAPRFNIGFANATLDNPWRVALVHSIEYGAAKYRHLISGLSVRHAAHDPSRQIADIEALLAMSVDGLIVSAIDAVALAPVLARAEQFGVPTVLVDRGLPAGMPHVSFVTCDDEVIGHTTALWLAEQLKGHGAIILLPGLASAEPAQRRLAEAQKVFAQFPGIECLATEWTGWRRSEGLRIMTECLGRHGDRIAGVWCDSGLQAVGSLQAFLASKRCDDIVPHTGGDLNLAYKLAVRHDVPLAAVDYPPSMGLRSVEILLDVLRGRAVPRRIDVATEIVITRGHATSSVRPDLWADEHVRWDLPDDLVLASGLGLSYDPRAFRVRYKGNRYNQSAAAQRGTDVHDG